MADDVVEELSAMRRGIRRIEDDVAELERKKASHNDVEPLVAKQTDMESFWRGRLAAMQNEHEEVRGILKKISESLSSLDLKVSSIDERLTKHKRETDNEIQAVKAPPPVATRTPGSGLPIQVQIIMYILIGVGILALLQAAPGALVGLFQRVT